MPGTPLPVRSTNLAIRPPVASSKVPSGTAISVWFFTGGIRPMLGQVTTEIAFR